MPLSIEEAKLTLTKWEGDLKAAKQEAQWQLEAYERKQRYAEITARQVDEFRALIAELESAVL